MINMKSKRKNFFEKTINFLLNILIFIFGIIFLISIYTGVQTRILGNDYTDFFGYSIFEVQTGSMADTINAGDWIIVQLTQKVKLNDIVTYELDGEYITHRIIEVHSGTYITRGDANSGKDEPIDQNQIVGKEVSILANFGIVRKTLFNPSVLIALIITLFLFNMAFKKNKAGDAKNKTSKFNKEENKYLNLEVIAKKAGLFTDVVIKKIGLFINALVKKTGLLVEKIKKLKNSEKSKKIVESNNIPKVESKDLKINGKTYDFDKFKELAPKVEDQEYYKDEDELDKTSFYRVIPVDAVEVDDKFKSLPTKAEIEEYYKDEDELDKTSLYRIIPVDASEVDDTFLEIAENEIKEAQQNDKKKEKAMSLEPKQEEKSKVEDKETLTEINLDLLKNRKGNKKSNNIIDTVMLTKKEELTELINTLFKDDKAYIKEASIKDIFITAYIDAKYYNYYGDKDIEYHGKNLILKIKKVIKEVASKSINNYHGNDTKYNDIVDLYANAFILIANLEQARDSITDLKAKNEFYKKEIIKYCKDWNNQKIKYVIDEIVKTQENYIGMLEYFLSKLETNVFDLDLNKLVSKKDMYGLELKHNISFSKVYSDYIIDKTYTEGIIAEDKMPVLLTLLLVQLVKDMILSDFNRKYILYIPKSLYAKEKKFEKLLRMIDDEYAKDNIIILITLEDLLNNKKIVKKVRKIGYKFALVLDKETVIEEKDRGNIYIADYIFVDKKVVNTVKMLSFIPEELLDNVIYEDIFDKVGGFGSE